MFKVLLVDDREEIVEAISTAIEWKKRGINILTCYNGKDALKVAKEEKPQMLITDICMPYIDGIELSEQIRMFDQEMNIVILTGYDDFKYAEYYGAVRHPVRYVLSHWCGSF